MKRILIYFFLAIFSFLSCKKESENPVIKQMSGVRGYKNWYIDNFRCGLFVPPTYDISKKYPLIIFLHGYTDITSWNLQWYHEPIVSNDPCIVLTPKCPKEEIYGWGDSFDPRTSPMMSKTYLIMDMVKQAFNIDSTAYGPADYEYKITAVNFYFKESVPSQPITITLKARGDGLTLTYKL